MSQCDRFSVHPSLTIAPDVVYSSVPLGVFQNFVATLNSETIKITDDTVERLSVLGAEFAFQAFSRAVCEFQRAAAFRPAPVIEDVGIRFRIAAPEARYLQRDREIAQRRSRIWRLEAMSAESPKEVSGKHRR
jgi:hypothetical protein